MAAVFRVVVSILAGVLLALILVIAVEYFSALVHPVPQDFGGTMDEMCQHVERYPHWVLAIAVAAWGGTAFASTWATARLGNRGCGIVVALLLLAAVISNVAMLPYTMWFKVVILAVIPAAILLALRSSKQR